MPWILILASFLLCQELCWPMKAGCEDAHARKEAQTVYEEVVPPFTVYVVSNGARCCCERRDRHRGSWRASNTVLRRDDVEKDKEPCLPRTSRRKTETEGRNYSEVTDRT